MLVALFLVLNFRTLLISKIVKNKRNTHDIPQAGTLKIFYTWYAISTGLSKIVMRVSVGSDEIQPVFTSKVKAIVLFLGGKSINTALLSDVAVTVPISRYYCENISNIFSCGFNWTKNWGSIFTATNGLISPSTIVPSPQLNWNSLTVRSSIPKLKLSLSHPLIQHLFRL